jgi:hypothetical protein
MSRFDAETLHRLGAARQVSIRTEKHPNSGVVIWLVVADDEVFVRSWRGARGRWYQDLAAGGSASLEFSGRRLSVLAIPTNDAAAIARVSKEFLRKYQLSSHALGMVRTEVLPTTLRLEPREAVK